MKERMDPSGFDAWAEQYEADVRACEEAGDYPFAGYSELQDQLFDIVHAREGVSVLELGCGTGRLTARLLAAGHPVLALDFSEKMLEHARKTAPQASFLQCALDEKLPDTLAGQDFDCIVASYSLHHLPDNEKYNLLKQLKTNLKPEGVILIGDVSFPDRKGLESVKDAYEDGWDDSEFYFVRDELEQALPEYDIDVIPISFCADVMILSPAE